MLIRSKFFTMMTTIFLGLSPGIALAQLDQPAVEQTNPSYSEAELKSFSEALLEVQRITDAYQPSLEAAKTPEDENRVREAATDEATQVITAKGISVDKYREILLVAQSNSEVADRIRQHLRNLQ